MNHSEFGHAYPYHLEKQQASLFKAYTYLRVRAVHQCLQQTDIEVAHPDVHNQTFFTLFLFFAQCLKTGPALLLVTDRKKVW